MRANADCCGLASDLSDNAITSVDVDTFSPYGKLTVLYVTTDAWLVSLLWSCRDLSNNLITSIVEGTFFPPTLRDL